MECLLQNHSSYPNGNVPQRSVVAEVVRQQEDAGMDIVTDGQIAWADPISHVMRRLGGVRIDGSRPYFGTQMQYSQPVITSRLQHPAPILQDDFVQATALARCIVKAVVPGPYTLARLSRIDCSAYPDVAALAHHLSELITAEVAALAAAGAQYIQIDEPAILAHPQDIRLVRRLLEPIWAARGNAQVILATGFVDAVPLFAELNSLPADIVALDIMSSPGLVDVIAATGASKVLALGVIDGCSTEREDPSVIVGWLDRMLRRYALDSLHLMPSCGLKLLSQEQARAKLAMLSTVRALAQLEDVKAA